MKGRKFRDVGNDLTFLYGDKNVTIIDVWSNGRKVRRYCGQDESSTWHPPSKGYRKMRAILIDVEGASE